jgi:hypothetical protein
MSDYDNDYEEIVLYGDNDEPLYRRKKAFLDNMSRKIERGTFDKTKSPALWLYWIKEVTRKYEKEFPGTRFTSTAKKKAAEIVAARELADLMSGEYGPPPVFKETLTRRAHSPSTFRTISDVKAANKAAGLYFFERSTMRFFNSRIESPLYKGRYFITSERGSHDILRRYTIREVRPNGDIHTVGKFQGYNFKEDARDAIKNLPMIGESPRSRPSRHDHTKKSPSTSVSLRAAHLCPMGTSAQTVLFDRKRFTKTSAVTWAKHAGFHTRNVQVGPKVIHVRQALPSHFRRTGFRHKIIAPGVALVVGCPT